MTDDAKRNQIRAYFRRTHFGPAIALLAIGLGISALATATRVAGVVALGSGALVIGLLLLVINAVRHAKRPEDAAMDKWFQEDLAAVGRRSLERLNLEEGQLIRESLVITGPILWDTGGVRRKEVTYRKGKDGLVRFSVNRVTIIHLTEHKLSAYQCDLNVMRGARLNERDDEYYYRDVVSVSTREVSTNYTLPNNRIMRQAESFTLSVSSGEQIGVIVSSGEILKVTGGRAKDTGVDGAIKAIRKVLGEKKI